MTFPALCALIVGIFMIGQWAFFLATDQVPELETEPLRIRFHVAAEFATAIALVIGGLGLLAAQSWSYWVYMVAMGMLLYTMVVSPGYFAQKGQWPFVGMFADLIAEVQAQLITQNYDYFDFIHTLLPTELPLKEFYAEYARLYRSAIPLRKGVSWLKQFPLKEIPVTLVRSFLMVRQLREAYLDYDDAGGIEAGDQDP